MLGCQLPSKTSNVGDSGFGELCEPSAGDGGHVSVVVVTVSGLPIFEVILPDESNV